MGQYHFVIFKPLSNCFEEIIVFDVKLSFASRPVSRLIRWYNKPGDITKEFWEKAIQFHGTFHGLKIKSWYGPYAILKHKHMVELFKHSAELFKVSAELSIFAWRSLIQFVIFNLWKVPWNWIVFSQNSFVITWFVISSD